MMLRISTTALMTSSISLLLFKLGNTPVVIALIADDIIFFSPFAEEFIYDAKDCPAM